MVNLGSGNDQVTGGTGVDTWTGGAGTDLFIFTAADQSPTGTPDVITDFVPGTDTLVFQGLLTGSFNYLGASALEVDAGHSQARFDDTTDVLKVDIGGDGTADMEIQLTGKSASQLSAGNFDWS